MVFENEHDNMVAGHMGMDKTLKMINRNFYCPRMAEDIEDYVRSCDDCQKNKASCYRMHGMSRDRLSGSGKHRRKVRCKVQSVEWCKPAAWRGARQLRGKARWSR